MKDNGYEGVFEKREVELIQRWAKRAGFSSDQVSDVLQEVAMIVAQEPDGWAQADKSRRRQLLWLFTRNTVGKIRRKEERRRQRDQQKAMMAEEAYTDDAALMRLDVQGVMAGLDERCQDVCELLSQGFSRSQIAQRMNCSWHAVDRLVRTIRRRLQEAEVNAWL